MAMADISIVPIAGEQNVSMGEEVAAIHEELEKHKDQVHYELTPMSTVLEGDIEDLFHVIQKLHQVPAERGWKRISTDIRIDDRRDGQEHSMEGKKHRVQEYRS